MLKGAAPVEAIRAASRRRASPIARARTQVDALHLILRGSVYVQWMTCFDLPCDQVNAYLEASYGDESTACVLAYL